MKKIVGKLFFMFAFLLGTMFAVVSCNDDDKIDDPTNGGGPGLTLLTPDQEKQNLEDIGVSLSGEINPTNYQSLIIAIKDFSSLSSNSDLTLRGAKLRSTTQSIESVIVENDLGDMMSLLRSGVANEYYTEMYASYSYNALTMQWDSIGNSTALVFNYSSQEQQAQISLQVSGDYFTFEEEGVTVYVPKTFTYSLKLGSTVLLTFTVNVSSFNRTTGVVASSAELSVPAANLTWYATSSVTSTSSTAGAGVKKGTANLISATATITGTNMSTDTVYTPEFVNNFNKGTVRINVKDRLYLIAECSDFAAYANAVQDIETQHPEVDTYSYSYDPVSSTTTQTYGYYYPEAYYQQMANLNNQYISAYFNYDNSVTQVAKLFFDYTYDVRPETNTYSSGTPPYVYTYIYSNTNDYSEIIPGIQFAVDGSKFSFSEYFNDNDFASFITSLQDLADTFEGYVNN